MQFLQYSLAGVRHFVQDVPGVPMLASAGAGARLARLGDTIPIPGLRKVVSPGDVLISAGACAFVVLAMRRRPEEPGGFRPGTTTAVEPEGANH